MCSNWCSRPYCCIGFELIYSLCKSFIWLLLRTSERANVRVCLYIGDYNSHGWSSKMCYYNKFLLFWTMKTIWNGLCNVWKATNFATAVIPRREKKPTSKSNNSQSYNWQQRQESSYASSKYFLAATYCLHMAISYTWLIQWIKKLCDRINLEWHSGSNMNKI